MQEINDERQKGLFKLDENLKGKVIKRAQEKGEKFLEHVKNPPQLEGKNCLKSQDNFAICPGCKKVVQDAVMCGKGCPKLICRACLTGENQSECPVCHEEDIKSLSPILQNELNEMKFSCESCAATFTYGSYQEHFEKCSIKSHGISCELCDQAPNYSKWCCTPLAIVGLLGLFYSFPLTFSAEIPKQNCVIAIDDSYDTSAVQSQMTQAAFDAFDSASSSCSTIERVFFGVNRIDHLSANETEVEKLKENFGYWGSSSQYAGFKKLFDWIGDYTAEFQGELAIIVMSNGHKTYSNEDYSLRQLNGLLKSEANLESKLLSIGFQGGYSDQLDWMKTIAEKSPKGEFEEYESQEQIQLVLSEFLQQQKNVYYSFNLLISAAVLVFLTIWMWMMPLEKVKFGSLQDFETHLDSCPNMEGEIKLRCLKIKSKLYYCSKIQKVLTLLSCQKFPEPNVQPQEDGQEKAKNPILETKGDPNQKELGLEKSDMQISEKQLEEWKTFMKEAQEKFENTTLHNDLLQSQLEDCKKKIDKLELSQSLTY